MFRLVFLKLSVLFCLISSFNAVEVCNTENTSKCQNTKSENKYTKDANTKYTRFLNQIEAARKTYVACNSTNCNCHSGVIKHDLNSFKKKITKQLLENIRSKGTKYQIIKHKLYREKDCMFPARCAGIEYFLLNSIKNIPDVELIINTRDWPQVHKKYGTFGPVLSFSKTQDYYDIMYPTWAFWEGGPAIGLYPKGIGRWDLHRAKLATVANETAWEDKINKAFFRGSRTSSERDAIVILSRERPDLVDAQYTKNQAWKSDADTLHAPPAQEVPFEAHCKYKYLFNFRGVAASFRFKHILLCKSLVFHVGNEWQEFFYPALKPWIHYVPVDANASKDKIKELLEFVMTHDDLAREIAENGFEMIWNNLRMKDVKCYWEKLMKSYAKLLDFEPQLDEGLQEIKRG